MEIKKISTCIITNVIEDTKSFYTDILDAKVTFDCGWYCSLSFDGTTAEIQFMTPQKESDVPFLNQGVTYNIDVDDVDVEYSKITKRGITIVDEIADHPWGDRSFVICDPNGVRLYIYSEREPSEEFLKAFNTSSES